MNGASYLGARLTPKIMRYLFLLLAAISASTCPGQDVQRMDRIVRNYVSEGRFMGSVLVARGDMILLDQGYGFANLEWRVPNTPDTKFRIGSITKQFTAASILLLADRGKVSLADPIKKYISDCPAGWDKVTIVELLTHTAGIHDVVLELPKRLPVTPSELVAKIREKALDYEPGSEQRYSNSGYQLLGYLLERISGMSYENFIKENLFKPLGITASGYDSSAEIITDRAAGYTPGDNGLENADFIDMTTPYSAGGLYSTTRDLLKWEKGLFGGRLLSTAALKKMTTPYKRNYALGLFVFDRGLFVFDSEGPRLITHSGAIAGFNSYLGYYPMSRTTVVILGNINGQAPDILGPILGALAQGESVDPPPPAKETKIPPDKMRSYVGRYMLGGNFEISITCDGGRLFEQGTDQPQFPILASSETKFSLINAAAQIEFLREPNGTVPGLIIRHNGDSRKAMRENH